MIISNQERKRSRTPNLGGKQVEFPMRRADPSPVLVTRLFKQLLFTAQNLINP
jgi:hypothetical protein